MWDKIEAFVQHQVSKVVSELYANKKLDLNKDSDEYFEMLRKYRKLILLK